MASKIDFFHLSIFFDLPIIPTCFGRSVLGYLAIPLVIIGIVILVVIFGHHRHRRRHAPNPVGEIMEEEAAREENEANERIEMEEF